MAKLGRGEGVGGRAGVGGGGGGRTVGMLDSGQLRGANYSFSAQYKQQSQQKQQQHRPRKSKSKYRPIQFKRRPTWRDVSWLVARLVLLQKKKIFWLMCIGYKMGHFVTNSRESS